MNVQTMDIDTAGRLPCCGMWPRADLPRPKYSPAVIRPVTAAEVAHCVVRQGSRGTGGEGTL